MPLGFEGTLTTGSSCQYVKDVTVDLSGDEVDKTTRYHNGWKSRAVGLRQWGVSFDMLKTNGDSAYAALKSAFKNRTVIAVTVTDGDGEHIGGNAWVTNLSKAEPMGDAVGYSVTLVGDGEPTWP